MEIGERLSQLTRLTLDDIALDANPDGMGYVISLEDRTYHLEVLGSADGRLDLVIDGRRVVAYVSSDGQRRWVTVDGRTFLLTRASATSHRTGAHDGSSELSAPMPGQVRTVNVNPGDAVIKGQVLIVLEAMKMEIRLQAPYDATVSSVSARVGQTVEREQILIRLQRG